MKDWILELCPELDDWQAELIAEQSKQAVLAERERVMQIVQSMKADLEAKFENVYMEGAMAGTAAEREACAKVCDEFESEADPDAGFVLSAAIRARSNQ